MCTPWHNDAVPSSCDRQQHARSKRQQCIARWDHHARRKTALKEPTLVSAEALQTTIEYIRREPVKALRCLLVPDCDQAADTKCP